MACTAIGSFPKEVPLECGMQLVTLIRNKGDKGEIMQTIGQVIGQTGALMTTKKLVGAAAASADATDEELAAMAAEAEEKLQPTEGKVAAIPWSMLLPILLPLIQRWLEQNAK